MSPRKLSPVGGSARLDPDVATTRLENGLRVVSVHLPHLHTATASFFVKAGPRFEGPGDNGLAHFVEHMLFRGTERYRSGRDVSAAVEGLGGDLYAETGADLTVFELGLPPERLEAGLELLGEVVLRPRFASLEAERTLVLEEMREDYDERGVETNLDDVAFGAHFDGHPLGQRVLGPRANVLRFGRADVRRHFRRHYVAGNAVLCIAGPAPHRRSARAARRHFAGLPAGAGVEGSGPPPAGGGPRLVHVDQPGHCRLALVLTGVPETDPGHVAFQALHRVLDDGMSTRLYHGLCVRSGLAYSVEAEVVSHTDAAVLQLTAEVDPGNVVALVREALRLLARLRERAVDEAELARVRARYRYGLLAQLDVPRALTEWFGAAALFREPAQPSAQLARMARVTAGEVREAARRVGRPDGLTVATVGALGRRERGALRAVVEGWR